MTPINFRKKECTSSSGKLSATPRTLSVSPLDKASMYNSFQRQTMFRIDPPRAQPRQRLRQLNSGLGGALPLGTGHQVPIRAHTFQAQTTQIDPGSDRVRTT